MRSLWCGLLTASTLWGIAPHLKLSDLAVTRWGPREGIPEETFAAIVAGSDGYVWMASNNGLVRFDGQRGRLFFPGEKFRSEGTGSCTSNTLSALHLSAKDVLWAGAASGCLYRISKDRFNSYANFRVDRIAPPAENRETGGILALHDAGSDVEILRRNGYFSRAAGGDREYEVTPLPAQGVVLATARSPRGRLLVYLSDRRVYAWDAVQSRWRVQMEWDSEERGTLLRLMMQRNGNVWIGAGTGLYLLEKGQLRKQTLLLERPLAPVTALLEDQHGCVWVGMEQAVARSCQGGWEALAVGVAQEEVLSTVSEDAQGNLWWGGRWGNLYRLSESNFRSFTRETGLPESHLTGVAVESNGDVWASLRSKGLVRIVAGRVAQAISHREIDETQALLADPKGGVLAAGIKGIYRVSALRVSPLHPDSQLPYRTQAALAWEAEDVLLYSNGSGNYRLRRGAQDKWNLESIAGPVRVRQWARDRQGRTWALAQFAGLHRLDGRVYRPAPGAEASRARAWYSLSAGSDGLLWLGTTDGLEVYSLAEGKFLTNSPLLRGDQVFHIAEDRHGKVWCATRQGIVRFARQQAVEAANGKGRAQLAVERFGPEQSLPTSNFGLVTSSTGAASTDGRLWFPGLLGLVSLQPSDFEREPRPPVPQLLEVDSDGSPQDLNRDLLIPAGTKKLSIVFATLRLDALGGNLCRHQLRGFDPDWIPCPPDRSVEYTNLPPKSYEFVVQTSSSASAWNGPQLKVPIQQEAAYHQRLWVQGLAGVTMVGLAALIVLRRQRQLVEQNRVLEAKVEERTAKLETAMRAAEAASQAKSEFLATMSHEIRTPMNGVLGAVQILSDAGLNAEQQKLVDVIRQSGEDLVGIVDDVLNLARVESGKLTLEKVPVPVHELGEHLIALFRSRSEAKGLAIRYEPAANVPPVILGDPQRLRQLLLNLVGNAVKFTEQGSVALKVAMQDNEPGQIVFSVHDTGLGIEKEQIPRLFDAFVQADSSTTRRYGGSGLGLAIVRRFVDALGGSIAVDSEVGKGSVFRVTLPLEVPTADAPERAKDPETPTPEGIRVLLAEDNRVNQLVFQKMLVNLGCQVLMAKDGRETLALLRTEAVDVVLMDCQMPELDGYEATREIRSWGGRFSELPVIALTASAMAEDRDKALRSGMNDFLTKPLLVPTLRETLAKWSGAGLSAAAD